MAATGRGIQRAKEKQAAASSEIEVSLGELFVSGEALQSVMNQTLPIRQAFSLMKLVKAVNAELETCNEARLKLCEQFGIKSEDGTQYTFPTPEASADFSKAWMELLSEKVTVTGSTISLSALDSLNVTATHLTALAWLIVE